jgi:hypothetical protein
MPAASNSNTLADWSAIEPGGQVLSVTASDTRVELFSEMVGHLISIAPRSAILLCCRQLSLCLRGLHVYRWRRAQQKTRDCVIRKTCVL